MPQAPGRRKPACWAAARGAISVWKIGHADDAICLQSLCAQRSHRAPPAFDAGTARPVGRQISLRENHGDTAANASDRDHQARRAGSPATCHAGGTPAGRGRSADRSRGSGREPAGLLPARGHLCAAARGLRPSRSRGRRHDRGTRRRRHAVEDRRRRVRTHAGRRLRAVLRHSGGAMSAGTQGVEPRRGRFAAGDVLHGVDQRVRTRQAGAG